MYEKLIITPLIQLISLKITKKHMLYLICSSKIYFTLTLIRVWFFLSNSETVKTVILHL